MVNLAIITHGEFGAYLVEAAESIVGRQKEGVSVVSVSPRLGVDEVKSGIVEAIAAMKHPDGLIVATDIPGGTPSNIVLPAVKDFPWVSVVSGLNLYMLVTAFNHRHDMSREELAAKMIADGQRSICDIKAALLSKVR